MSTVEEIERAVEQLAPEDFARLSAWIDARRHAQWTRQMDRDAAAGRLDFLFEEAEAERAAGQLHDCFLACDSSKHPPTAYDPDNSGPSFDLRRNIATRRTGNAGRPAAEAPD
jgi:hypothetical protein